MQMVLFSDISGDQGEADEGITVISLNFVLLV